MRAFERGVIFMEANGKASAVLFRLDARSARPQASEDGGEQFGCVDPEGDVFYRDHWSHGRTARSAFFVNRTVFFFRDVRVKGENITWETREADDPPSGAGRPEGEARRRPRGAASDLSHAAPPAVEQGRGP
ncbi:hypothetical protein PWG71_26735 [Nocardiopsis sp. N85]|uniref:hypothetical protein n=1 Tax=Nocardiopsis sp. N85 TaxID=3029400 RepID=UPI00237F9814|nr:hypothetical protein [Nocardiopsis sp. N85]MDE3724998.1 hypothetical protein [Nocardiopsis sp. N85]